MNLFRPYQMGEPQRDARGRLVGIDRYQDVLGRNWKRFFLTGLVTMLGCLPLAVGVAWAILSSSVLVLLPACLLGGAVAGPFLACLYDTILRALRDAPGTWGQNYRRSLAQNWKAALVPGALTGLFLGAAAFAGMMLFFWSTVRPTAVTVVVYLFSWLVFLVVSTLYWPQLVLFDQRPMVRLRNALLFTVQYFWVTVGTALLQLVWWLLMVLFAPWTLLLLPFVGSWFDLFVALFLLYDRLDKAFEIEKSIARAFPEQAPRFVGGNRGKINEQFAQCHNIFHEITLPKSWFFCLWIGMALL